MFICGGGSFGHEDDDELSNSSRSEGYDSPVQTPKRSKRQAFCKILGKDTGNKNPFADRGLDKFNALLADHDNKKQQIYRQINPEEISFVRFTYTNDSKDPKPIVVRVKEKNQLEDNSPRKSKTFIEHFVSTPRTGRTSVEQLVSTPRSGRISGEQLVTSTSAPSKLSERVQLSNSNELVQNPDQVLQSSDKSVKRKRSFKCDTRFNMRNLKRPQMYLPVMVLMILIFLAISGRVFSIMCTSIGWFVIPTVIGGRSNSTSLLTSGRKVRRKKEYEKDIVKGSDGPSSPTSVLVNTLTDDRNQLLSNRRN